MYIRWLNLLFINLNSYYIIPTANALFAIADLNVEIKSIKLLDNINIGPELAILDNDHDNIFIYNVYYGLKVDAERQDLHLAISFIFNYLNFKYFKLVAGKTINFHDLTINVFFLKSNNLTIFGLNIEKKFNKYKNIIISINANTIRKEFKHEQEQEHEKEKHEINFKTLKCLEPNQKDKSKNLKTKLKVIEFSDHMITYIKDDKKKQSLKITIDYLWQVLLIEDKLPSKELINTITKNYLNKEKKLLPHNYYIKDDNLNFNFKKEFINFLEYFKNNNKYKMLQITDKYKGILNCYDAIPNFLNFFNIKNRKKEIIIDFNLDINLISIIQLILTYFYTIISKEEFKKITEKNYCLNFSIYNLLNNPNGIIVKLGTYNLKNAPINIKQTLEKQLNNQQNNL